MKPRLEPLPLTDEDVDAWLQHLRSWYRRYGMVRQRVWDAAMRADRRDAYVMLFLESARADGCHATLTRCGQLHGFIGSFVRLPAIPPKDEDYA